MLQTTPTAGDGDDVWFAPRDWCVQHNCAVDVDNSARVQLISSAAYITYGVDYRGVGCLLSNGTGVLH